MNAYLLYRDRDFAIERALPPRASDLTRDLGLATLFDAMADGDRFLYDVAERVTLASLTAPDEIRYRQAILRDCLAEEAVVREMYAIAVEAIERERKIFHVVFKYPEATLHRALEVLEIFVALLKRLRGLAGEWAQDFQSHGFATLFATLRHDLSDEYFQQVETHLRQLRFERGVMVSARLGRGNQGTGYTLRQPRPSTRGWRQWLPFAGDSALTLVISDRDEAGLKALGELRGRGIDQAANALAQSADHILSFFRMLRVELGFYLGGLNLARRLAERGGHVCFPDPAAAGGPELCAGRLYDVGLRLRAGGPVVDNDLETDGARLLVITGANRGGKSTFLRGLGLAQVMMQCGLFVGAESYRAATSPALFTHFRREEDASMNSGKLDEELSRMRAIAGRLARNDTVLFNESFAATNEREGAEIASGIVQALLDAGVRVLYVTHSYELAHGFSEQKRSDARFLRAERLDNGERTFRVIPGEPLPTSFGPDLYAHIFGDAAGVARAC